MATETRQKILNKALELFAENGYKETTLRDIANALNISKSAIYRYFSSKEDIRNTLLEETEEYYVNCVSDKRAIYRIVPKSREEFLEIVLAVYVVTVHDQNIIDMRKMLTTQQFKDEKIREVATKYFLEGFVTMFTRIFKGMMNKGVLKTDDPKMLAFSFVTPISSLVSLCDRDPKCNRKVTKWVTDFTNHFMDTYGEISNA